MSSFGKVIGGAYLDSTVATATFESDLVVQTGFKGRKLTAEHVKSWEEIPIETKDTAISAMGKAAAGVALPGRFGKAASAAVGAAFDSKKPPHHIRVDWVDGKQSLLKLPDALFTHLALVLGDIRIASAEPAPTTDIAPAEAPLTVTDKAFDLVSGLVKDRFSSGAKTSTDAPVTHAPQVDVTEQLRKLASLRDAGILSEEEFALKKTELLGRL